MIIARNSSGQIAPIPVKDRFWGKVEKNGPVPEHRPGLGRCWIWLGARIENDYGVVRVNGKNNGAHRISWELTNGPIPEGLWALHHCDNPPCVNPSHLFLGTNTDNQRDCVSKGRDRGSRITHDKKGHPLFGENLAIYKERRKCKICNRENAQRIRDARKEGNLYVPNDNRQ